ncbi:MAG TPA: glycosyltransferase [bacterium]|nr:glycosyltransferase [bacterium]
MAKTIKIISLFGDGGRYAGLSNRCAGHEVFFWKYYFDDYFSVDPNGENHKVDKSRLRETVSEIYSGKYDAAACDGNDALLLQFFARSKGLKPLPFIINEVDLFEMAGWVGKFINRHYKDDIFDEFIKFPLNNWIYIISGRKETYLSMGVPDDNLYYLPTSTSSIEFYFPNFFSGSSGEAHEAPAGMENSIIAAGSHNRDYETFARALEGTGLKADVVTNFSVNPPLDVEEISWHESLPEPQFFQALKNAKFVVVPLHPGVRASGQLACAVPMKAGKIVIAAAIDSVKDMIEDGVDGFLYEPGCAGELRDKLVYVENNPDSLADIGKNAVKKEKKLSEISASNIKRLLGKLATK